MKLLSCQTQPASSASRYMSTSKKNRHPAQLKTSTAFRVSQIGVDAVDMTSVSTNRLLRQRSAIQRIRATQNIQTPDWMPLTYSDTPWRRVNRWQSGGHFRSSAISLSLCSWFRFHWSTANKTCFPGVYVARKPTISRRPGSVSRDRTFIRRGWRHSFIFIFGLKVGVRLTHGVNISGGSAKSNLSKLIVL